MVLNNIPSFEQVKNWVSSNFVNKSGDSMTGSLQVQNSSGSEVIGAPSYATEDDLPNASEGEFAYVQEEGTLYVEDGE